MKKILLSLLLLATLLFTGCSELSEAGYQNVQFVDETGTAYGIKEVDNKPRVSCTPYLYDIAEGNVIGHEGWSKIGFNPNVGTTQETAWSYSTAYVFPVAAMQMEVVSTDNLKDIPGGTGALAVTIYYLDGNYAEHSEVVAINGTTAVLTTHNNIFRVNDFVCTVIGTDNVPAGNIILRGAGGGTVYSHITAGYTIARSAVYTVPEGYTLYITSVMYSSSEATKGVRFINQANYDNVSGAPRSFFLPYGEVTLYNTALYRPLELPTAFPEHTDIKVSVISAQAGAIADVSLRGWLETN